MNLVKDRYIQNTSPLIPFLKMVYSEITAFSAIKASFTLTSSLFILPWANSRAHLMIHHFSFAKE